MEALVSIIVPVYNCDRYLEKCLESITNQSYTQVEILVINDGSTDNSQEIVDRFKQKDQRIVSLYQDNDGVASARNNALKCANGKYYLFVDGDDYVGTDYVRDLVECAEQYQSELVFCGYTLTYLETNRFTEVIPDAYVKDKQEEWVYRISSVCSRLYSGHFWKKNGLQFIKEENARGEDVPIALFANIMAHNIRVLKKADYFYVQHEGSAMHSKGKIKFLFPYKAFEEMYIKIKNMGIENSKVFYNIGILKFLAQFEYVLYKNADRHEKQRFHTFISTLLKNDINEMCSDWNGHKMNIDFPFPHKVAISLFCRKIKRNI